LHIEGILRRMKEMNYEALKKEFEILFNDTNPITIELNLNVAK
jgi:hypothetical protein